MEIGKDLEKEVFELANHKLKLSINENSDIQIANTFDKENQKLVESIEIIANEDTKSNIIIKYTSKEDLEFYHNGIIRVNAKENANVQITIVNFLNTKSNNFISIENELEENANVNYTIVDFGGKHSITNYYSSLSRKSISK